MSTTRTDPPGLLDCIEPRPPPGVPPVSASSSPSSAATCRRRGEAPARDLRAAGVGRAVAQSIVDARETSSPDQELSRLHDAGVSAPQLARPGLSGPDLRRPTTRRLCSTCAGRCLPTTLRPLPSSARGAPRITAVGLPPICARPWPPTGSGRGQRPRPGHRRPRPQGHRGCRRHDGRSYLETELNTVYPRENLRLAERIVAEGGAIISEFPPGRAARSVKLSPAQPHYQRHDPGHAGHPRPERPAAPGWTVLPRPGAEP